MTGEFGSSFSKTLLLIAILIPGHISEAALTYLDSGRAVEQPATIREPESVIGEVIGIDARGRTTSIESDTGPTLTVAADEHAIFSRPAPGETSPANAQAGNSAIGIRDRLLIHRPFGDEKKRLHKHRAVVLTRSCLVMPRLNMRFANGRLYKHKRVEQLLLLLRGSRSVLNSLHGVDVC